MADERPNRRIYSEREMNRILKRARELESKQDPLPAYGLTLEELQQIAAESGLDPRLVAAAAGEMERGGERGSFLTQLTGPLSIQQERTLSGELTEAQWEAMVAEIRQSYEAVGTPGKLGQTFEWTFRSPRGQQLQVSATPREGMTHLRVYAHYSRAAIRFYAPLLSLAFAIGINLSVAASFPVVGGFAVILALLASLFLVARFAFGRYAAHQERKANRLLDRLERLMTTATPASPMPVATEAGAPLSLPDAPPESETAAPSRNRTSA
jgi:hypothetical protein